MIQGKLILPEQGSLLVSGACGFIGRALAIRASQLGLSVTGLCLHRNCFNSLPKIEMVTGNIADLPNLEAALAGRQFDYVINLAGYIDHRPLSDGGATVIEQHFTGTMNLISVTRHEGLRGFVQVGTSDEYGDTKAPQNEDAREAPISPYSLAKTAAGHLVTMLHRSEGFPGKVARLFLVYGPGQSEKRFIPQLISGALDSACFPVSAGGQLRDFCHVDDVVDGLLALLACGAANGHCVNLASGKAVTIRDVIERVVRTVGSGTPDWGSLPYRSGENMALVADMSRARSLLNWTPKIDLDEGLALTIEWYRQHGEGDRVSV